MVDAGRAFLQEISPVAAPKVQTQCIFFLADVTQDTLTVVRYGV